MKIVLTFTAVLKLVGAQSGSAIDVAEHSTVAALLNRFKVPSEHQKYVIPFINGRKARLTATLRDKDELCLSLPLGGG